MALAKFNNIAQASISKISGVSIASIAKLNGITVTPASAYLIDQDCEVDDATWTFVNVTQNYASPALVDTRSWLVSATAGLSSATSPTLGASYNALYCRFQCRFTSPAFAGTSPIIFRWRDVNTVIGTVTLANNTLRATTTGGTSNTSTDAITLDTTIYVWTDCIKGSGTDATVKVGWATTASKPALVASGGKTAVSSDGTTTNQINKINFGWTASATCGMIIDEILVSDSVI